MGPDSLPPIEGETKTQSMGVWLMVCTVFIAGLAAGVLIPAGMKLLGFWGESRPKSSLASKEATLMPLPNGKLRKVEAPISNQPIPSESSLVATAPVAPAMAKVEKKRSSQLEVKLSAHSSPSDKTAKKKIKNSEASDKRLVAKESKTEKALAAPEPKTVAVETKANKTKMVATEENKSVTSEKKPVAPTSPADLIEEVPSALSAQQVQKLLVVNNSLAQKNNAALARPVSLPPSQALNQGNAALARPSAPLPMMKSDPKSEGKTYPVTINNASFSKATLGSCSRRCALLGMDALGNPIKAVIDGQTFAAALLQHNGTINISGQPRIIKNQQVLVVENITFNLSATPKVTPSKTIRSRQTAAAVAAPSADAAGYTEIPADADDLKPGTVIKSRKQIPNEGLEDEGNP